MAVSPPSQSLVVLAFTPDAMDRAIRDVLRGCVLVGELGSWTKDQEQRDACITTVAHLHLLVSKFERALEVHVGVGEG
jgi:hypothetical protein